MKRVEQQWKQTKSNKSKVCIWLHLPVWLWLFAPALPVSTLFALYWQCLLLLQFWRRWANELLVLLHGWLLILLYLLPNILDKRAGQNVAERDSDGAKGTNWLLLQEALGANYGVCSDSGNLRSQVHLNVQSGGRLLLAFKANPTQPTSSLPSKKGWVITCDNMIWGNDIWFLLIHHSFAILLLSEAIFSQLSFDPALPVSSLLIARAATIWRRWVIANQAHLQFLWNR